MLADRAIALDPAWHNGALHELFITLDSLPEALGGNADRAKDHFTKAVDLQKGLSPGPYVSFATGVMVANQNRAEFERLLKAALAIDPEKDPSNRLATLVTQKRAQALLDQIDTKFVDNAPRSRRNVGHVEKLEVGSMSRLLKLTAAAVAIGLSVTVAARAPSTSSWRRRHRPTRPGTRRCSTWAPSGTPRRLGA